MKNIQSDVVKRDSAKLVASVKNQPQPEALAEGLPVNGQMLEAEGLQEGLPAEDSAAAEGLPVEIEGGHEELPELVSQNFQSPQTPARYAVSDGTSAAAPAGKAVSASQVEAGKSVGMGVKIGGGLLALLGLGAAAAGGGGGGGGSSDASAGDAQSGSTGTSVKNAAVTPAAESGTTAASAASQASQTSTTATSAATAASSTSAAETKSSTAAASASNTSAGVNQDQASLSAVSQQNQQKAAALETVRLPIDAAAVLNKPDAAALESALAAGGKITVSGAVESSQSLTVESVNIVLNGKTYAATVNGTSFAAEIAAADFAGGSQVQAQAAVRNASGSTALLQTAQSYSYDKTVLQPAVTINPVTADNIVGGSEAKGKIYISGSVRNAKQGDTVEIAAGSKTYSAKVNAGAFAVEVEGPVLAAANTVRATLTTTDAAGKVQTATASHSYQTNLSADNAASAQPAQTGTYAVKLNPVTADGVLDVTEAQNNVELGGYVSGAGAASGQRIEVHLNNKVYHAVTGSDLSFKVSVPAQDLTDNSKGYLIDVVASGTDSSGQRLRAGVRTAYQVAKDEAAQIDITSVGNGAVQDVGGAVPLVRIYGKVDLGSGVFAEGRNDLHIHSIKVTVGGSTFEAGVDKTNLGFHIDVPADVMATAAGKAITYEFVTDSMVYDLQLKNTTLQVAKANAAGHTGELKAVFSGEGVTDAGNGRYTVGNIDKNEAVQVSGTVGGTAKAGDTVVVSVGDSHYETVVRQDKTFSTLVTNTDLLEDADQTVTATLKTTDKSNRAISVEDKEIFARGSYVSDGNGRKITSQSELPYFIKAVRETVQQGFLTEKNIPIGGGSQKLVVKYHFVTKDELAGMSASERQFKYADYATMDTYSDTHKAYIRSAYKVISQYINVEFVEVDSHAAANTNFFIGNLTGTFANASAIAYTGGNIIWNNKNDFWSWGNDFVHYTAVHEILHTLGEDHTNVTLNRADSVEDSSEFTNMSYNLETSTEQHDLRVYDMAYLHYRFGVNSAQRSGNDVYSFQKYNGASADAGIYIWDGAGNDTFDASHEKQGVNVNLTPGSWIYSCAKAEAFAALSKTGLDQYSYFGLTRGTTKLTGHTFSEALNTYTKGQAFIGYGTNIENLNGSAFDDVLTGNGLDNNISGGAGNDTIAGGAGNDYLDGGSGADKLVGGAGNDVYAVDNALDTVTEAANEGTDHVYSRVDYALGSHLEKLTLIGGTAVSGSGNGGANTLQGNGLDNVLNGLGGNDRIIGGRGSDTLTGGAGKDTFVFDSVLDGSVDTITDFAAGEDLIELSRSIFGALGNTLAQWQDYVQYNADTGALSYDADGKGQGGSVHFANIGRDLEIQQNSFIVV